MKYGKFKLLYHADYTYTFCDKIDYIDTCNNWEYFLNQLNSTSVIVEKYMFHKYVTRYIYMK